MSINSMCGVSTRNCLQGFHLNWSFQKGLLWAPRFQKAALWHIMHIDIALCQQSFTISVLAFFLLLRKSKILKHLPYANEKIEPRESLISFFMLRRSVITEIMLSLHYSIWSLKFRNYFSHKELWREKLW